MVNPGKVRLRFLRDLGLKGLYSYAGPDAREKGL